MFATVYGKTLSFFYRLNCILNSLFTKEYDPEFTLSIPNSIVHRTKLICSYIKSEHGYDFELENFLMLLYLDFIKNSIRNYNPKKLFNDLSKNYYEDDYLVISTGDYKYNIEKTKYTKIDITIIMSDEDVEKGQLILDELYDLYHYKISFSKLLENLWIGFIEDYKCGINKRAYHSIVKLLKDCLE